MFCLRAGVQRCSGKRAHRRVYRGFVKTVMGWCHLHISR